MVEPTGEGSAIGTGADGGGVLRRARSSWLASWSAESASAGERGRVGELSGSEGSGEGERLMPLPFGQLRFMMGKELPMSAESLDEW